MPGFRASLLRAAVIPVERTGSPHSTPRARKRVPEAFLLRPGRRSPAVRAASGPVGAGDGARSYGDPDPARPKSAARSGPIRWTGLGLPAAGHPAPGPRADAILGPRGARRDRAHRSRRRVVPISRDGSRREDEVRRNGRHAFRSRPGWHRPHRAAALPDPGPRAARAGLVSRRIARGRPCIPSDRYRQPRAPGHHDS